MKRFVTALIAVGMLTGCGGTDGPKPAGPDVRGINLADAKLLLKAAKISPTVHADTMFGVLVDANYIVCDEAYINATMVRLEVDKQC
jgi:hypothetical protein